ncbi:unnamed protein product [Spirodela intermedia]|uniref:Poly(A) RNA polymerase mitochondrial-like central palm domain-containing protein n=1 Tax=Spirodela intermedia TaxID=51605 RepID=A0A7I8J9L3_SPIIN|nr:unnamed protein product [Spirodela intermedia]CAA6666784.1 unnamed protein product [Spirodela intermedia]
MKPEMGARQIFDDLTAHIALFHSSAHPSPSNSNPRKAILRWFSSLSVHQRQACLTVVDSDFVKILLQMLARLQNDGHCHFFILPDLPSTPGSSLPSLCYRLSGGLLSRASASNESERLISSSVRLFGSQEGEQGTEYALDSMTVSEDLLQDPEKFVTAMDGISSGGFLRELDLNTSQSAWVEFEWLKAKGYYSIESFLSNKLELALRMSWLECHGGKKPRAGKSRVKVGTAGVAANVFWRQKGCLDWWLGLGPGVRKKVILLFLCKGAKTLVLGKRILLILFFGSVSISSSRRPCRLANLLNAVLVLQEISEKLLTSQSIECVSDTLFFSTLGSVNDISDCILRRLRGFLMSISSECIKIELTEDCRLNKSLSNTEGSLAEDSCKVKKKGRNSKKLNSTTKASKENSVADRRVDARKPNSGRKGDKIRSSIGNELHTVENPKSKAVEVLFSSSTEKNEVEKSAQFSDSLRLSTMSIGLLINGNFQAESEHQNAVDDSLSENKTGKQCTPVDSTVLTTCECSQSSFKLESDDPIKNFSEYPPKYEGLHREVSPVNPVTVPKTHCPGTVTKEESGEILGCKTAESAKSERKREKFCSEDEIEQHNWKVITDSAPQRASIYSQCLSPGADILHLDAGDNFLNHTPQSFYSATASHQAMNASSEVGGRRVIPPRTLPMSLDWPLMVRGYSRLSQSVALNFDNVYNSRLQSSFCSGPNAHGMQKTANDGDRKYSGDGLDFCEFKNALEVMDDAESYWISEDESDMHIFTGRDYNQFFGGGVMYWNTSDHVSTGFSRAPSHSSEDGSWAWHEADLNRSIDDMVGMPTLSGSLSVSGVVSPPATPFCSPFETLGPGPPSLGYAFPGNDASGLQSPSPMVDNPEEKAALSFKNSGPCPEGVKGDSLSYPVLRPIIIPSISRKGSRSEFKINHDHNSPCVTSTDRDFPRIKRPSSPVVLCVPRAPRPPPPSLGDSRKRRGFPVVRSGSSSPRSWGMRSWHHEENTSPGTHICLDGGEVIWASWENGKRAGTPMMQPVPESLLQDRLIAISHRDQEHPDIALPVQSTESNCSSHKMSLSMMHSLLHEEIDSFCKKVAAENLTRKPFINWAVKRVAKSLQVLWPRSRTSVFGSNANGLALPSSDVDLVICLPPVRNLEPIKEAGILEGRNGIKETCLQHAARYLANQDWVKNDSLKTIENTAIPLIMLIAEVPYDINDANIISSGARTPEVQTGQINAPKGRNSSDSEGLSLSNISKPMMNGNTFVKSIRIDISFMSSTHTGLRTTGLVRQLTEQFPASIPLALVLKQFLADRNLDHSYSGGLSSYCLVLLIIRFLQHEHHLGRSNSQNLGSLLMDFLYFLGMPVAANNIDPIHIDDPLCPTNNVGKNCFRIHQCIKAFADAYSVMDNQLTSLPVALIRKIMCLLGYCERLSQHRL